MADAFVAVVSSTQSAPDHSVFVLGAAARNEQQLDHIILSQQHQAMAMAVASIMLSVTLFTTPAAQAVMSPPPIAAVAERTTVPSKKSSAAISKREMPVPQQQLETAKSGLASAANQLSVAQKELLTAKAAAEKAAAVADQATKVSQQSKSQYLDANDKLAKLKAASATTSDRAILQQQTKVGTLKKQFC